MAENQTITLIPKHLSDGVDRVHAVAVRKSLHHHAHDDRSCAKRFRTRNARKAGIALPVADDMANALLNAPAQPAAKKVLQPLAELLPAQAAAELVQPGAPAQAANNIQPLAELQHVLMRRRWTRIRRIRTRRIPLH